MLNRLVTGWPEGFERLGWLTGWGGADYDKGQLKPDSEGDKVDEG